MRTRHHSAAALLRAVRTHCVRSVPSNGGYPMTLEELVRAAAAKGELVHLSLTPTADGKSWFAMFTPASTFGYVTGINADPVEALCEAISNGPKAIRRAALKRDVTTTVKNEIEEAPTNLATDKNILETKPETAEDWLPVVKPRGT